MLIIGLISGTSADGIDAALVDIEQGENGLKFNLISFKTYRYPEKVRRMIMNVSSGEDVKMEELFRLHFLIGDLFASAALRIVKDSGIDIRDVALIGSHGQTLCHYPSKGRGIFKNTRVTFQAGELSVIAERTGIITIGDFRIADMAAGGQGAPLSPYFHYEFFKNSLKNIAVQNFGGIGNVTFISVNSSLYDVIAFDTGPGNALLDSVIYQLSRGRKRMDRDGRIAVKGKVNDELLHILMNHPFLKKRPPKSTSREEFGGVFLKNILTWSGRRMIDLSDLLATLVAFTVRSVEYHYRKFLPWDRIDEIVVCGGGSRNPSIMKALSDAMDPIPVRVFDDYGINADAVEAVTFALLARQCFLNIPANIPSVTGAKGPVILGKIVPGRRIF